MRIKTKLTERGNGCILCFTKIKLNFVLLLFSTLKSLSNIYVYSKNIFWSNFRIDDKRETNQAFPNSTHANNFCYLGREDFYKLRFHSYLYPRKLIDNNCTNFRETKPLFFVPLLRNHSASLEKISNTLHNIQYDQRKSRFNS